MKTQLKFAITFFLCLATFLPLTVFGQSNGVQFQLGYGIAVDQQLSNQQLFNDAPGQVYKASLKYYRNKIGLGLDVGLGRWQSTDLVEAYAAQFTFPISSQVEEGNQPMQYAVLGPELNLGSGRLQLNIGAKIGVAQVNQTNFTISANLESDQSILVNYPAARIQTLVLQGTAGIQYKLSERIGLELSSSWLTNGPFNAPSQHYQQIKPIASNEEAGFQYEEIINAELVEQKSPLSTDQFQISAGVVIRLTGNSGLFAKKMLSVPLNKKCDCYKDCIDRNYTACKDQKRSCKDTAKARKRAAKSAYKRCKSNCSGSRRQKRQCKRACKRTFRAEKRTIKREKKRCRDMKCKRSNYDASCKKECGCS